jgi:hypothetical protein
MWWQRRKVFVPVTLAVLAVASMHCSSTSDGDSSSSAQTVEAQSCHADSECGPHLACVDAVCRLERCTEPPQPTEPPFGKGFVLRRKGQLLAANGADARVDAYDGAALGAAAGTTTTTRGVVTALAGGAFFGADGSGTAVVVDQAKGVSVLPAKDGAAAVELTLAFTPVAIAAGDLDADGSDDVVAIGPAGEVATCHVADATCQASSAASAHGIDVAVGDVDGDGALETILLTSDAGDQQSLTILKGESQIPVPLTASLTHIAVGDIDGDRVDEIVGLEDRGFFGVLGDRLHLYRVKDGKPSEGDTKNVDDSEGLAVGSLDGSGTAQVVLLHAGGAVEVLGGKDVASLTTLSSAQLGTANATVLAIADVAGRSATAKLVGDHQLVSGQPVPIVAMYFPPYSADKSDGKAQLVFGAANTDTKQTDDQMSLRAAFAVGYQAGLPVAATAGLTARVEASLTRTATNIATMTLGESFTLDPHPEEDPSNTAGVLVGGACYRAFSYAVSDPGSIVGEAAGKTITVYVPVSTQRAFLSLPHYNALAKAVGHLPILPSTARLGDPSSYPTEAKTTDGQPIAAADLVLKNFTSYTPSDTGKLTWRLALSSTTTNQTALTATATATATATLAGGTATAEGAVTGTGTYTVTLGADTSFSGIVPALKAGSDEAYSFTPILYRQHYENASFYLLTYTVKN